MNKIESSTAKFMVDDLTQLIEVQKENTVQLFNDLQQKAHNIQNVEERIIYKNIIDIFYGFKMLKTN